MSIILTNLRNAVITGIVLTVIMVVIVTYANPDATFSLDHEWSAFFIRWLHVLSGVMWIGLLWYLNFVQIPNTPNIPDEQKPAISKVIAPAVLFWFRWAAMATLITGLLLAHLNSYLLEAILLGIELQLRPRRARRNSCSPVFDRLAPWATGQELSWRRNPGWGKLLLPWCS